MTEIQGPDNVPGKKTELVILEPATATILGLLHKCVPGGRIQINSEKHTQEIKVIGVSKICNIFSGALQHAW